MHSHPSPGDVHRHRPAWSQVRPRGAIEPIDFPATGRLAEPSIAVGETHGAFDGRGPDREPASAGGRLARHGHERSQRHRPVVPPAATPVIFQADTAPTARILSVDTVPSPADPTAPLSNAADIPINNNNSLLVVIRTNNFPVNGIVKLRKNPKFGTATLSNAATLVAGGTFTQADWTVSTSFVQGFTTLQAIATVP